MFAPKKSINQTKEVLRHSETLKKKRRVGKLIILFILFIFLFWGLGYILYMPALFVQTVGVQGNSILDSKKIIDQVNQTLKGNYWYIFPKRSVFLYPKKNIKTDLLKIFPRLSAVEVGLGEWDALVIDVKERDSDIIWCKDKEPASVVMEKSVEVDTASSTLSSSTKPVILEQLSLDRDCYFADDNGFIFAPAPYFSNSVFIELSGFLADDPIMQTPLFGKSYMIVTHFAKNLVKVFNRTNNGQYRLIKVKILDKNSYEAIIADTSKTVDNDWKILFDEGDSVEDLTNNLYTVLNSDPFKKEMEKNKTGLALIDLRYGKKVFYKFK